MTLAFVCEATSGFVTGFAVAAVVGLVALGLLDVLTRR